MKSLSEAPSFEKVRWSMHEDGMPERDLTKTDITSTNSPQKSGTPSITVWYYDYPVFYRWLYLVVVIFCSVCTGPGWMNWMPVASILESERAYQHLCSPRESMDTALCPEQRNAINNIVVVATTTMFVLSFAGGIILDCFGAKITTLFGLGLQILGWIILGASGPNFNGYLMGFALMAGGNDPIFFGLLSTAHLFPGWLAVVIAMLGSARSLSFAIFLAMDHIWDVTRGRIQLSQMSFFFAGMTALWVLLAVWFVPYQSFPQLPEGLKFLKSPKASAEPLSRIVNRKPKLNYQNFLSSSATEIYNFAQAAISIKYIPLLVVACFTLIRSSAYSVATGRILVDAENFYGIMGPLTFLPCILLGYVADSVSAAFAMGFVAICGGLSMFLGVFYSAVAIQYISVLFNWFFICFLASQFYCFVSYSYRQELTGRLVGFALACGGVASLIVIPIDKATVKYGTYTIWYISVAVFCFLSASLAALLYVKAEKPYRKEMKQISATTNVDLAAENLCDAAVAVPNTA